MKQGLLAFQYQEEKSTTGMTALSGLMTYVELMHAAGLRSSVERRVGLRRGGQSWTDSQARRKEQVLTSAPALWTVLVAIGLTLPILLGTDAAVPLHK